MKYLLSAATFLTLFITSCASIQHDGKSKLAKNIDRYLQAYEKLGFSGAVLVAEKGEITLHKGYGYAHEEVNKFVSESTLWTIGSITKPLTAAAILKLEMQGKLSVSDSISIYIDELKGEKRNITVHQLLTHTAGLREYSGPDDQPMGTDDFIEFVNVFPFKYQPGGQFSYSNVGYSLLGILIERVSGQSYEEYVHRELLAPAGMRNTGYNIPQWDKTQFAHGYKANGDLWGTVFQNNEYDGNEGISWNLKGNGGLISTPMDMYKWSEALKNESILSQEAKVKYFDEHVQAPGDFSPFNDTSPGFYGYGWAVTKSSNFKPVIMHGGSNDIFEAGYMYYPEDDIFFFLSSNRVKYPSAPAILDFDKIIGNKPYEVPKLKKEVIMDDKVVADYLGEYSDQDGGKYNIERGEGEFSKWLAITPLNSQAYQTVIGKKIDRGSQEPFRVFAEDILMKSKSGKPFQVFMGEITNPQKSTNKENQDQEVIIGGTNKSMTEIQADFWKEQKANLGAYKQQHFWGAVQVHDRYWTYHKVYFERGSAFILHVIGDNELKRISFKAHEPLGLFLKPVSSNSFREVNNEALYEFTRDNKTQGISLKIQLHDNTFQATKD